MINLLKSIYISSNTNKPISIILQLSFLIFSIILLFSLVYHLRTFSAWHVPLGYGGDLWLALTIIQAYMLNEIPLFGFKFVSYLNAPDVANWNDYPITEDFVFFLTGKLASIIGLYKATNILLLFSHLLAGISFWSVCKYYRWNSLLSFSAAIAFAFSHFIFIRGLGHIVVGLCWHIPILLMIINWIYSKKNILLFSGKFYFALSFSMIAGLLNPYYSIMYCQLLLFSIIYFFLNDKFDKIKIPLILLISTILAFIAVNSETILYGLLNGVNKTFSGRNIPALELYALKIPDMFFSPGGGTFFTDFSRWIYFDRAYLKGEYWSPYLGFFGITAFILFFSMNTIFLLKNKIKDITVHYWHSIWIILFSIVGGINLLVGIAGFTFLRATNRLSIFILVIVTLYFVYFFSKKLQFKGNLILSLLILYSVWYEQLSPRIFSYQPPPNIIEKMINEDKVFIQKIENRYKNVDVFQLPVMQFPEVGPIHQMADYENLRMSLNSNYLNFSYGSNKGRGDSDWQYEIENSSPDQMINLLEKYGFTILTLTKKGFIDNGEWLIEKLSEKLNILSESNDFIAFELKPLLSESEPIISFSEAWSQDEITHRWAMKSKANINIRNFNEESRTVNINFEIFSIKNSYIKIYHNNTIIKELELNVGDRFKVELENLKLIKGKNTLKIISNRWPVRPGGGDNRKLTFAISNLELIRK